MSNLSHTIRHMNRFELKYMINLELAERIRNDLTNYLVMDDHANENGKYWISSLYYDSPDFRCYWEKMDGIKFRRKLRIRFYENGEKLSDKTPVFVEIKQRYDRVTQKRRLSLPYKEAIGLSTFRVIPAGLNSVEEAVAKEIISFGWQYNLHPVSLIRYQRQAFFGNDFDTGLRVTLDTHMVSQQYPFDFNSFSEASPMFSADQVILEIKVNERIPYWLTELVATNNLRMVRVSKYCRSIDQFNVFPSISANYLLLSI